MVSQVPATHRLVPCPLWAGLCQTPEGGSSALCPLDILSPLPTQGFSAQDGLGHRVGGGQDRMGGTRWAQKDRWLPSGLSEVERPSQLSVNSQGPRQDNLHLRRVQMYLQHQRECFCEFPYVRIICDLVRSFVTLV